MSLKQIHKNNINSKNNMEINMSAIDENITKYENWLREVEKAERELKDQLANLTVNKAIYRSALYTLREMKQKEQKLESNGDN